MNYGYDPAQWKRDENSNANLLRARVIGQDIGNAMDMAAGQIGKRQAERSAAKTSIASKMELAKVENAGMEITPELVASESELDSAKEPLIGRFVDLIQGAATDLATKIKDRKKMPSAEPVDSEGLVPAEKKTFEKAADLIRNYQSLDVATLKARMAEGVSGLAANLESDPSTSYQALLDKANSYEKQLGKDAASPFRVAAATKIMKAWIQNDPRKEIQARDMERAAREAGIEKADIEKSPLYMDALALAMSSVQNERAKNLQSQTLTTDVTTNAAEPINVNTPPIGATGAVPTNTGAVNTAGTAVSQSPVSPTTSVAIGQSVGSKGLQEDTRISDIDVSGTPMENKGNKYNIGNEAAAIARYMRLTGKEPSEAMLKTLEDHDFYSVAGKAQDDLEKANIDAGPKWAEVSQNTAAELAKREKELRIARENQNRNRNAMAFFDSKGVNSLGELSKVDQDDFTSRFSGATVEEDGTKHDYNAPLTRAAAEDSYDANARQIRMIKEGLNGLAPRVYTGQALKDYQQSLAIEAGGLVDRQKAKPSVLPPVEKDNLAGVENLNKKDRDKIAGYANATKEQVDSIRAMAKKGLGLKEGDAVPSELKERYIGSIKYFLIRHKLNTNSVTY